MPPDSTRQLRKARNHLYDTNIIPSILLAEHKRKDDEILTLSLATHKILPRKSIRRWQLETRS